MRFIASIAFWLLLASSVSAQTTVKQSGSITPGQAVKWISTGVIGSAGTAAAGSLTSIGTTAQGPSICANSGPITGAYNRLCLGVTANAGATISSYTFGGATNPLIQFDINGTLYQFPFSTSGVIGPNSTTVGHLAIWNNTTGTLLADATTVTPGFIALTTGHILLGSAGVATDTTGTNAILSANNSSIVAFNNIITGQNYLAAMTNTGEAYGYSFRNTTTTGQTIYTNINVTPVNLQDGIQSIVNVPGTSTVSASNGFANYATVNAVLNYVGFFTAQTGNVASAAQWGMNTLLQDNATRTTHVRTGQVMTGLEADFNVMGTGTEVIGVSVGGASLAQPSIAHAFLVNQLGGGAQWDVGFWCLDGTTRGECLVIGASATSGASKNSQVMWFQYFDAGSSERIIALQATVPATLAITTTDPLGMTLSVPGGATFLNTITQTVTSSGVVGPIIQLQNNAGALNDSGAIRFSDSSTRRASIEFPVARSPFGSDIVFYSGATGTTEFLRLTTNGGLSLGQNIDPGAFVMTLKPQLFGSLTTCSATNEGSIAAVTDSNTATWGATVAGSSTNHVLAYCDGTVWTVAGK